MSTTTEPVKPSPAYGAPRKLGDTARRDRWWIGPVWVVTSLSLFGVYTILRVILGHKYPGIYNGYFHGSGPFNGRGGYLAHLESPFFSPDLATIFGFHTSLPWGFLVLWAPLGLRSTCYYYRKSYYRSFFLAPPSCAVAGAQRKKYSGETRFPWVLNNVHRYMWYAAAIVIGFLWYDFFRSLFYIPPTIPGVAHIGESTHIGVSLGSLIMLVNVVCLSAFTFGCNSWRHIIGGHSNCFDCSPVKYKGWKAVTHLNLNHRQWAWISMFTVWGCDLYIWLAGSGVFTDPHIIF